MSLKFVLDSYAWVEYAIGTKMGEFVDYLLKNTECITPSIVIGELSDKFHHENHLDEWKVLLKFIKHTTEVIFLDTFIANQSGKCKEILRSKQKPNKKKVGLADAIIYQTAINQQAQLVTGDEHFATIQRVIYLKNALSLKKWKLEIKKTLSDA